MPVQSPLPVTPALHFIAFASCFTALGCAIGYTLVLHQAAAAWEADESLFLPLLETSLWTSTIDVRLPRNGSLYNVSYIRELNPEDGLTIVRDTGPFDDDEEIWIHEYPLSNNSIVRISVESFKHGTLSIFQNYDLTTRINFLTANFSSGTNDTLEWVVTSGDGVVTFEHTHMAWVNVTVANTFFMDDEMSGNFSLCMSSCRLEVGLDTRTVTHPFLITAPQWWGPATLSARQQMRNSGSSFFSWGDNRNQDVVATIRFYPRWFWGVSFASLYILITIGLVLCALTLYRKAALARKILTESDPESETEASPSSTDGDQLSDTVQPVERSTPLAIKPEVQAALQALRNPTARSGTFVALFVAFGWLGAHRVYLLLTRLRHFRWLGFTLRPAKARSCFYFFLSMLVAFHVVYGPINFVYDLVFLPEMFDRDVNSVLLLSGVVMTFNHEDSPVLVLHEFSPTIFLWQLSFQVGFVLEMMLFKIAESRDYLASNTYAWWASVVYIGMLIMAYSCHSHTVWIFDRTTDRAICVKRRWWIATIQACSLKTFTQLSASFDLRIEPYRLFAITVKHRGMSFDSFSTKWTRRVTFAQAMVPNTLITAVCNDAAERVMPKDDSTWFMDELEPPSASGVSLRKFLWGVCCWHPSATTSHDASPIDLSDRGLDIEQQGEEMLTSPTEPHPSSSQWSPHYICPISSSSRTGVSLPTKRHTLDVFPSEIWQNIMEFVDPNTLLNAERVSRDLLCCVRKESIWATLCTVWKIPSSGWIPSRRIFLASRSQQLFALPVIRKSKIFMIGQWFLMFPGLRSTFLGDISAVTNPHQLRTTSHAYADNVAQVLKAYLYGHGTLPALHPTRLPPAMRRRTARPQQGVVVPRITQSTTIVHAPVDASQALPGSVLCASSPSRSSSALPPSPTLQQSAESSSEHAMHITPSQEPAAGTSASSSRSSTSSEDGAS